MSVTGILCMTDMHGLLSIYGCLVFRNSKLVSELNVVRIVCDSLVDLCVCRKSAGDLEGFVRRPGF